MFNFIYHTQYMGVQWLRNKAKIFLLVGLPELIFRFRVGDKKKKALKMTRGLVIFRMVIFRAFFITQEKNSKTSKVNKQSVLYL